MRKISSLLKTCTKIALTASFLLWAVTSCTAKNQAQNILGKWQHEVTLDTEIGLDSENPEISSAVIRYKVRSEFEFLPDGTFVSKNEKKFISYTSLNEKGAEVDAAELEEYFSETTEMRGVFKINEKDLRYEPKFIKFNGGEEMSYAKYLQQNSLSLAESAVAVPYKMENGELLIYRGQAANETLKYRRQG